MKFTSWMVGILLVLVSQVAAAEPVALQGGPAVDVKSAIERLDPALDELLAADAVVELVAQGFNWAEGPVWMPAKAAVWFSDVPENRVYAWQEGVGLRVALEPSGFTAGVKAGGEQGANGLALDAQGRLVLAQHGDRRVARLAPDEKNFETVIDRVDGRRFSSPNDLCYDRAGNLYFTDPPYGLPRHTKQETEFHGVYRLSADGKLTVIERELSRPNGVALSPDERTLYVGSTDGKEPWIKAYTLDVAGAVTGSRVFFDSTELRARTKRRGGFDGLKVDTRGNVWATGPGGVLVISAEGKHLGTILTGRATANCAFGGPEGRTLFITADEALLRVRTRVAGAGVARDERK